MLKIGQFVLLLLVICSGIGCAAETGTTTVAVAEAAPPPLVHVDVTNGGQSCRAKLRIHHPTDILYLNVQASAENGILFTKTQSTVSTIETFEQFPGDTKYATFDCILDQNRTWLSGEYRLRFLATLQSDPDNVFINASVPVYVVALPDQAPYIVANAQQFAQAHGFDFKPGSLSNAYALQVDNETNSGVLWVKISSPFDGYQPELKLDVMGAIYFAENSQEATKVCLSQQDALRQQSVRVFRVPFWINPNEREGTSSFRLTLNDATLGTQAEFAPVVVQLASPDTPQRISSQFRDVIEAPPLSEACSEPQATQVVESVVWQRELSNISGNRWEIFEAHIDNSVPIEWLNFKQAVLTHNPHLVMDGYVFRSEKTYLLPEIMIEVR